MNNQMPYGFMPQQPPYNQGCQCSGEVRRLNEKVENLERQLKRLERKVASLENNNMYAKPIPISNMPTNDNQYSNNYMI